MLYKKEDEEFYKSSIPCDSCFSASENIIKSYKIIANAFKLQILGCIITNKTNENIINCQINKLIIKKKLSLQQIEIFLKSKESIVSFLPIYDNLINVNLFMNIRNFDTILDNLFIWKNLEINDNIFGYIYFKSYFFSTNILKNNVEDIKKINDFFDNKIIDRYKKNEILMYDKVLYLRTQTGKIKYPLIEVNGNNLSKIKYLCSLQPNKKLLVPVYIVKNNNDNIISSEEIEELEIIKFSDSNMNVNFVELTSSKKEDRESKNFILEEEQLSTSEEELQMFLPEELQMFLPEELQMSLPEEKLQIFTSKEELQPFVEETQESISIEPIKNILNIIDFDDPFDLIKNDLNCIIGDNKIRIDSDNLNKKKLNNQLINYFIESFIKTFPELIDNDKNKKTRRPFINIITLQRFLNTKMFISEKDIDNKIIDLINLNTSLIKTNYNLKQNNKTLTDNMIKKALNINCLLGLIELVDWKI